MYSTKKNTPKTPKLRTVSSRKIKDDSDFELPSTQKTIENFFKHASKNDKSIARKPNRRQLNFDKICLDSIETVDLTFEPENSDDESIDKKKKKVSTRKSKRTSKTPKKKLNDLESLGIVNTKTPKPSYYSNIVKMKYQTESDSELLAIIPPKIRKEEPDQSFSNKINYRLDSIESVDLTFEPENNDDESIDKKSKKVSTRKSKRTSKTPKKKLNDLESLGIVNTKTPKPSYYSNIEKMKYETESDSELLAIIPPKIRKEEPDQSFSNKINHRLDSIESVDLTFEPENNDDESIDKKSKKVSTRKSKRTSKTPKKKLNDLESLGIVNTKTPKPSYYSNIENMKYETESDSDQSYSNYPTPEPIKAVVKKQCPKYKIVEGTTFAVDAFRFGDLEGVTHYFLTHFHADHYIGLKKSFCYKLYASKITARLVTAFVGVKSEYITIIELNESVIINDVEITAIDANHCPGAILLAFKLPNGKCILHTGDFRASPDMESEPYFWNNDIHTIYLDTTYLSVKYLFKPQHNSIADAINCIKEFQLKHIGTRILYVAGSYLIGKEKVWLKIAETFGYKVYLEKNRRKAVETIGDVDMLQCLVDDPLEANIHVIPMQHMYYLKLVDYLKEYSSNFDMLLALRPSGWEYRSKPRHQGAVSLVGIEYSEHSSFYEMRRFVTFLQPKKIISTVPIKSNVWETMPIPDSWYNNEVRPRRQNCQFSISSYMKPLSDLNQNEIIKPKKSWSLSPGISNSPKYKNIKDLDPSLASTSNDLQSINTQIKIEKITPVKSPSKATICEVKVEILRNPVQNYVDDYLDLSNTQIKEEYQITDGIDDDWLI